MTYINLTCKTCNTLFKMYKPYYEHRIRKGQTNFYCCRQHQPRKRKARFICEECGKETTNRHFCSRQCSSNHTAKTVERRKGSCKNCDTLISTHKRYCEACSELLYPKTDLDKRTLEQCRKSGSNNYHSTVRVHAKKKAEETGLLKACAVCKYDTIVECCHIKPVSKFPPTTTLEIVNSIDNLIGLCPNHHGEFDKGILDITNHKST